MQKHLESDPASADFAALLGEQRAGLVRLCARISGSRDVAEDLAQETLIEAWRQQHRLVDWSGAQHWMAAIARYVCLRWRRQHGREWAQRVGPVASPIQSVPEHDPVDPYDLEGEFERHELLVLLDRALALLPADARSALIQRYVEEFPYAEIAARMQVSEGAVAMRLQRSKRAFRQLLDTELRHSAAAYGLVDLAAEQWDDLRVWCPFCGASFIRCRQDSSGSRIFQCPRCTAEGLAPQIVNTSPYRNKLQGYKNLKTILGHALDGCNTFYRAGLERQVVACPQCGMLLPVHVRGAEDGYGLTIDCPDCAQIDRTDLRYLVLDLPETRAFWREHPRMRVQPTRPITYANQAALLTIFERSDGAAAIEVISDPDTLAVRSIQRTDRPASEPLPAAAGQEEVR